MDDLDVVVGGMEMWDLECRDRRQRQGQRLGDLFPAVLIPQVPTNLPQGTKDLRSIETLPVTVFTKIRHRIFTSIFGTCTLHHTPGNAALRGGSGWHQVPSR